MKSGKQRRVELKAKKEAKRQKVKEAVRQQAAKRGVAVDRAALAPHGSYEQPEFVYRGYYEDLPFVCKSCSKEEVWAASQQKWWYEVIKGNVFTTARLCRPCRQQERERKENARRVHLEGLARKERNK